LNDAFRRPRLNATWTTFSYLAVWAFVLYGLGSATPYIRDDLALTGFEAGLHASALAVGLLISGATADALARRIGAGPLLDLAALDLTVAVVLVAVAPTLPISLAGAFLIGIGGGLLVTHVHAALGRSADVSLRRLLAQANALAMVTAAAAPIALGLAAAYLHAWRIALLLPIVGVVALMAFRPRGDEAPVLVRGPRSSLPPSYWFVWTFIVITEAIEFSFVFWGSTVVSRRTGISSADATLLASLFIIGMFAGRAAVGAGIGAGRGIRFLMAAGLAAIFVGGGLVWLSSNQVVSGLGLCLSGLGAAGMWPLGVTVALQSAPDAQMQASARTTLASGLAVLLAPSALGLVADKVGILVAWPTILGLAAAALVVLAVTPSPSATGTHP
jgi:MFS family permease